MKLRIWTEAYRPFIIGGDCYAPISTDVEVGEPVHLDHGITVYLVTSPTGEIFVAESVTGAFVGSDIKQVRNDVSTADPKVLKEQIKQAKQRVKKADPLSQDDFWRLFK